MIGNPLVGQMVKFKPGKEYKAALGDTWHNEDMLVAAISGTASYNVSIALIRPSILEEFYSYWSLHGNVASYSKLVYEFNLATYTRVYLDFVADYFEVGKLAYIAKTKELVTIKERAAVSGTGMYIRYLPVDKNSPVSEDDMNIYGEHDPDGLLSTVHDLRPLK